MNIKTASKETNGSTSKAAEKEDPDSRLRIDPQSTPQAIAEMPASTSILTKILNLLNRNKPDSNRLRDALEELITEAENEDGSITEIASHERVLISNVIKLQDLTVVDVMIPRADIIAVDFTTTHSDLLNLLAGQQYSRLPVYRESLDDIVGTVHIKDILAELAKKKEIKLESLIRDVPFISPSMPVLDLILFMKRNRKHMALVIDEYGGIDGLITIGDVIEAIIGEMDDEHDIDNEPQMVRNRDGSLTADARLYIEEFEQEYGEILSEEEREEIDTLGGLIFSLAGRVPARGEILTHKSGVVFEILDADPRRVNRVMIKSDESAQQQTAAQARH